MIPPDLVLVSPVPETPALIVLAKVTLFVPTFNVGVAPSSKYIPIPELAAAVMSSVLPASHVRVGAL
ncbi:MAG: hypothetical protein EBW84_07060 [Betaproteobacteria bacterium]|nr:hypothetical protein [Betaproteobacteria bacterium]